MLRIASNERSRSSSLSRTSAKCMGLPPLSARRFFLSPAHNVTPIPRPRPILPPILRESPGHPNHRALPLNPWRRDHRRSKITRTFYAPNSPHLPKTERTGSAPLTVTPAPAVACLSPKASASSYLRAPPVVVTPMAAVTAARSCGRAKSSTPAATATPTWTMILQTLTPTPLLPNLYVPPPSHPTHHHVTPIS